MAKLKLENLDQTTFRFFPIDIVLLGKTFCEYYPHQHTSQICDWDGLKSDK
jgi:hypothetical protein